MVLGPGYGRLLINLLCQGSLFFPCRKWTLRAPGPLSSKYQVFSVIFFVMFADDVVWRVIVVPIEASRPQGLTVSKPHFNLQSEKKVSPLA